MNVTALPEGAVERLAQFAELTATTPPVGLVEDEGDGLTFGTALLEYAGLQGLSLDWFWSGDARSLVMQAHHAAQRMRA